MIRFFVKAVVVLAIAIGYTSCAESMTYQAGPDVQALAVVGWVPVMCAIYLYWRLG